MKIKLNKILVLVLVLALMATTAYALPNNNNGNGPGVAPGQAMKSGMFNDLEGWQWAERFIERMAKKDVIKGVGNGAFMPSNTAKEIETIAMLIRALGLEDELDDEAVLPKEYNGKKPSDWMIPYIELANEKGLISYEELETFDPNFPTKRSKAAVYFVRAADIFEDNDFDEGYVAEAEDSMDEILPYKDFNSIPKEHIGYIYVASELGLLQGYPGGTFQANKAINRAELAAMMARLDENYETDSSYVLFARIEAIDLEDEEITLKPRGKEVTYDLSDDVDVYIDDQKADLEDLEVNIRVEVYIENDEIIEISYYSDYYEYREKLEDLFEEAEDLDEDNYTEESWEDLEDALDDAEDVLDDSESTLREIKAALDDLDEAIEYLVYTTDLEVEDEDVVTHLDNEELLIVVAYGTTVEDLEDALESEFNASFVVLDEGEVDPVEEDELVTEEMVVQVTAQDEETVVEYDIEVEEESE